MSHPKPKHPGYTPRGYEWVLEAYERDIKPHGEPAREKVRVALSEGDIIAKLYSRVGEVYDVPTRMWRKRPEKVLSYFRDGQMRFRLVLDTGPYVIGPIFVPAQEFSKCLAGAPHIDDRVGYPSDWFDQVVLWFTETYIPQHKNDAPNPTRDEAYRAARSQFPGWPINRDNDWRPEIWKDYAPDSWKALGAKSRK